MSFSHQRARARVDAIILVGSNCFDRLSANRATVWAGLVADELSHDPITVYAISLNRPTINQPGTVCHIGERVGFGKDILLTTAETKLWFLSDIFLLPKWTHYRAAFSAGDVLISVGAFLFLWSLGGPSQRKTTEEKNVKDL